MKKYLNILFIIITSSLFSQEITGEYWLKNKDYTLNLKENGEFVRIFSVSWCAVGMYAKGTYRIESEKLILNYNDLDYDNPIIKDIKIDTSERIDSLQTINVKIVDGNSRNISEYYFVQKDNEIYFPEIDSDIKIRIVPENGTFLIKSHSKIFKKLEVSKNKNYQVKIVIEPNVEKQDVFEIIKQKENLLVLKDVEFKKRLKFIKN